MEAKCNIFSNFHDIYYVLYIIIVCLFGHVVSEKFHMKIGTQKCFFKGSRIYNEISIIVLKNKVLFEFTAYWNE